MTELHYAAYCQDLESVKRCVESGADIHQKHDGGWTALVWAVNMASTGAPGDAESIVDYLVSKGASLEFSNDLYKDIISFAENVDDAIASHLRDLIEKQK